MIQESQNELNDPRKGCPNTRDSMPLLLPLYNTAGHENQAWKKFKTETPADILYGKHHHRINENRNGHVEDFIDDTGLNLIAIHHNSKFEQNRKSQVSVPSSSTFLAKYFRFALENPNDISASVMTS